MKSFLIFVIIFSNLLIAQNNNLSQFNSIFKSYLDEQLLSMDFSNRKVSLNLNDKKSELLKTSIFNFFSTKNVNLFINSNESDFVLFLSIKLLQTKYLEIVSFPLFSDKFISRENTIEGNLSILDRSNNSVILNKEIKVSKIDTLAISVKDEVEYKSNEIITNELPTVSIWRSVLEPFIFTAATAATFYAFFSIRSK